MNILLDIAKDLKKKKIFDKWSKLFDEDLRDDINAINVKAAEKVDDMKN